MLPKMDDPLEECRRSYSRELYSIYEYELARFAQVTNLHGMGRWKSARSLSSKLFWAALVLAVMIFSICEVVALMSIYMAHPTMSQVQYTIPEDGLTFPAVTICNYNPMKLSYVHSYYNMSSTDVQEYLLTSYMEPGDLYASYTMDQLAALRETYANFSGAYLDETGKNFSVPEFFWNVSYTCEDTYLACAFGGVPFNCCQYAQPLMTDMGKCYRFTDFGHNNRRQLLAGIEYGFQVFIDIKYSSYPLASVGSSYEYGVRMSIQQDASSTHYITSGSYAVSPGFRFYAGLLPTHHVLLSEDNWGKCRDQWPDEEKPLEDENYSAASCRARCEAKAFLEKCDCVPMKYFPIEGDHVCDSLQLYTCMNQSYILTDEQYWTTRCSHCTTECDRWTFGTESSYASFPSQGAIKALRNRFQLPTDPPYNLNENLLSITTYYTQIGYTEYQQVKATSMTQTFSNIGGTLGLFIGFSVITFFEFSIFVVKVLWGFLSIKRRHIVSIKEKEEELQEEHDMEAVKRPSLRSIYTLPEIYSKEKY